MSTKHQSIKIVLASSSPYRAQLLSKLKLPFSKFSPDIDETALPNEAPKELASRLAKQKALFCYEQLTKRDTHSYFVVIGSDQVAFTEQGEVIGKPYTRDKAIEQLQDASGSKVHFYTALCVVSPKLEISNEVGPCGEITRKSRNYNGQNLLIQSHLDETTVSFRALSTEQIKKYVMSEDVLHCAGSFKSEGLGISLFEQIVSSDPNSLVGLPLIKLCTMLNYLDVDVLTEE